MKMNESPRDRIFRMMKEDIFQCFGIDDDDTLPTHPTLNSNWISSI